MTGGEMSLFQVLVEALTLTLWAAPPYLYAALGEIFAQRSGVLNLGVEGIMLVSSFAAIFVASDKGLHAAPVVGLFAAIIVGGLLGLLAAVVNVTFKAEQGISGIGLSLFGRGVSSLLFIVLAGGVITAEVFPKINVPVFSGLPVVGEILFQQNILVYIAFGLVPICAWVLNKTTWGLQIRAVGQNPKAADAMGVNVSRVRYQTVILGGILAGVSGASLSIGLTGVFQENMTAGRGFIAVALVYFGAWSPWRVMLGALLFSVANNLNIWAQILNVHIGDTPIPSNLLSMMPYILTIAVLVFARQRQIQEPAALTKPFERGEN